MTGKTMRRFVQALALVVAVTLLGAFPVMADSGTANTVFGEDYVLSSGEQLLGDLTVFGGSASLMEDSFVDGSVAVFGGDLTLAGTVSGDVVVFGGQINVESTALIEGDLVNLGSLQEQEGAQILGDRIGFSSGDVFPSVTQEITKVQYADTSNVLGRSLSFILILGLAVLAVLIAPRAIEETNLVMTTDWIASVGIGALTIVLVIVLAILFGVLSLICIGIPLLLVLGVFILVAALFGWAAVGRWLGQRLARLLSLKSMNAVTETLLGAALLGLLSYVPCVGTILLLAAEAWGVGALLITKVDALQQIRTVQSPDKASSGSMSTKGDTQKLFESEINDSDLDDSIAGFTALLNDMEEDLLEDESEDTDSFPDAENDEDESADGDETRPLDPSV